nr:hypothetical protein [Tanacetum cinerariifolium]
RYSVTYWATVAGWCDGASAKDNGSRAIDWVRLIEDCQLGIMGLANFMWEGAGAHGMSEGSVTVRVRKQELSIVYNNTLTSEPKVSPDFENEFLVIVYNDASICEPKISAEST